MKPIVTITNWELVSNRFQRVRPHFEPALLAGLPSDGNGKAIVTSKVMATDGRYVVTASGSRYLLGEPKPSYVSWLAERDVIMDDANPLGVRP